MKMELKQNQKQRAFYSALLPAVFYTTSSEVGKCASKSLVGPIRTLHKKTFPPLVPGCVKDVPMGTWNQEMDGFGSFVTK